MIPYFLALLKKIRGLIPKEAPFGFNVIALLWRPLPKNLDEELEKTREYLDGEIRIKEVISQRPSNEESKEFKEGEKLFRTTMRENPLLQPKWKKKDEEDEEDDDGENNGKN